MSEVDSFIDKFSGLTESYWFYNHTIELRYDPKAHVYLLVLPDGTLEVQEGVTTVCHILDKSKVLVPWGCKMMAQKLHSFIDPVFDKFDAATFEQQDLNEWIEKSKSAHRDKLEDAGEVGHFAHHLIEEWIKSQLNGNEFSLINVPEDADSRVLSCCRAALGWCTKHNVRFVGTERKIYSRRHKYAGTMDGLAKVDSCDDPNCCPEQFKDRLTVIDWKTSNYLYPEFILQTAAYKQAYEEETGEIVDDIWVIRLGKEDAEFEAWHVPQELQWFGLDAFLNALVLKRAMAHVEEGVALMKDFRKSVRKAEKAAEKEANLKIKCKNADKYKGIRKPTCNRGNPCETCLKKYSDRLKELQSVGMNVEVYEVANEITDNMLKSLQNLLDKTE